MTLRSILAAALVAGVTVAPVSGQQVTKEDVPGIRNFARLETTIACGGATEPQAMPALKEMGFASVFNLRLASEPNVDIPAAEAAARAANLNYFHIPFSGQKPDPAAANRFLEEITKPANEPAYIHCAGGNRAASMWMIKRLVVDKWDADRAADEATALGMTSPTLRQFAIDYAGSRNQ